MKKDCKIVQDLLPSYIEKLTSKDTNEYVEGHLKTCEDCTKVYNDMKADLKANVTSPKAEIDYMKKVRKKMKIAEKLLYIVLLLFIIFVLVFWREIFSFICYTDICNRYLKYQEEVQKTGKFTLYQRNNESIRESYRTPELSVNKHVTIGTGDTVYTATLKEPGMPPNTMKLIRNSYKELILSAEEPQRSASVIYQYMPENMGEYEDSVPFPLDPYFSFDKTYTFWELMSSFTEIRGIRIDDGYYEIDFKEGGTKAYLFRGDKFLYKDGQDTYTLRIGEVSEKEIEKALAEPENTVLIDDYSNPNRNYVENKIVKLSNCDQEAGTIVVYNFKVSKEEDSSLKYLSEVYNFDDISVNGTSKIERLREASVVNPMTYKKFQERWSGLRDLTDDDFINYTAIIVVDTDNTKELHYKNTGHIEDAWAKTDIYMTESEAKEEYQYSGCLLLVPNHMLYEEDGSNGSRDYMVHIANN